jgi:hypothetical protein
MYSTAADRILRAGTIAPVEASVAPVSAPVTADTWRQSAASGDSESGAGRHVAIACDTPRHTGLGLHNRRLQVRFLSHPPKNSEFMDVSALWS